MRKTRRQKLGALSATSLALVASLGFSKDAYANLSAREHFSLHGDCGGCHGVLAPVTNFVARSGPTALEPNQTYTFTISVPGNARVGVNAFHFFVTDPIGNSIGSLVDDAGAPIPDANTATIRKEGSKLAENDTAGTLTTKVYRWKSPAGPNEIPSSVNVRAIFMDNGRNSGNELFGTYVLNITKPGATPPPTNNPGDQGDNPDDSTTTSTNMNTVNGSGFRGDIEGGCGLIKQPHSSGSSTPIAGLLAVILGGLAVLLGLRSRKS